MPRKLASHPALAPMSVAFFAPFAGIPEPDSDSLGKSSSRVRMRTNERRPYRVGNKGVGMVELLENTEIGAVQLAPTNPSPPAVRGLSHQRHINLTRSHTTCSGPLSRSHRKSELTHS